MKNLHYSQVTYLNQIWGYDTMNQGIFPTVWMKPSSMEEDGYSKVVITMFIFMDFLESGE